MIETTIDTVETPKSAPKDIKTSVDDFAMQFVLSNRLDEYISYIGYIAVKKLD